MQPLRIRIDRIVDFGTVVSLVGIDTETAMAVTIHVDHRPFASFWQVARDAGSPPPIEYEADRLMLHLDMLPAGNAKGLQLAEIACSGATTRSADRHPVRETDR
jgi:hypothetical protein